MVAREGLDSSGLYWLTEDRFKDQAEAQRRGFEYLVEAEADFE